MRRNACFAVCLVIAVVGTGLGRGQEKRGAADPTAKARMELASKAYRELFDDFLSEMDPPGLQQKIDPARFLSRARAEEFYSWSRRWMEAERDLGGDGAVAVRGHLDRMQKLERGELFKELMKTRDPDEAGKIADKDASGIITELSPAFAASIKFFRLEAESWLAKAPPTGPR